MKNFLKLTVASFALLTLANCAPANSTTPTKTCKVGQGPELTSTSDRIETLLSQMTLSEKIGQLHQKPGGRSKNLNSKLTPEEFDRVRAGNVGSYLHVAGAEPLRELQRVAVEESKHGIPLLFAMDVVHGYRTIFPVPIGMASTWEPEAWRQAAVISALEASSAGLHWTFAPMIDIARDPRWGRIVEGAGSDPYLGSRMAVAQVKGYQGEGLALSHTLLATAKHFGVYGAPIGGRDYGSSDVSDRSVYETYLPPFYAASQAGSGSMMTAFNDVGGVPMTAHKELINETLRAKWGFDGMIVSDWNAVAELINHGVADNRTDAGALALLAGIDMDMAGNVFVEDIATAISGNCELTNALDNAVRRILLAKERLGLLDNPFAYHDVDREAKNILTPANRSAARDISAKAIVLLKNEANLLPLPASGTKIAVVGDLAEDSSSQLGSWRAQGRKEDVISLLDGIKEAADDVTYAGKGSSLEKMIKVAKAADSVILVTGEHYDLSGEARSRSTVELPEDQQIMTDAILKLDKPTVVVLTGGRPLALPKMAEDAPAILQTWLLGVEAGPALADVIFGLKNPGGKLPVSMPRSTGQAPLTYSEYPSGRPANPDPQKDTNRYMDQPITPLFPFGHGLSYSTFEYGEITLSQKQIKADEAIKITIPVTNTGKVTGDEVVQLYVRDPLASVARPMKTLRGFKRISLDAGETKSLTFELSAAQTALFSEQDNWIIESGKINIMIGSSSSDIRAKSQFKITDTATSKVPAAAIATKVIIR